MLSYLNIRGSNPISKIRLLVNQCSVYCNCVMQLTTDLQWSICGVLKSLVRTERNQQVMCESCLPHELLSLATLALADEMHPLHQPLQYIFERLAAQSLTSKDLRYKFIIFDQVFSESCS